MFRPDPKPPKREKENKYFINRSAKGKKICRVNGCMRSTRNENGICDKNHNYRIKSRSDKRAKQEREYSKARKIFLKGKICPVTKEKATEIHHKKGRIETLLTDQRYWLAVSSKGHKYIHDNPEESYEKGWMLKRTN